MKQFDVLHRSLELQQNYLLEASAGTGKTFSIQHLVVRLLIGSIALPEILVVTFTRESTRILKSRIRRNIDDAIAFLTQPDLESIPDYLAHVIEQGEPAATQAKKRLQEALFVFDQAQIFTIHSFCARMLNQFSMESGTNFHSKCSEDPLHDGELIQIINDYFRSEVVPGKYSRSLLELYLKEDPYRKKLLKLVKCGHGFAFSSFHEYVDKFQSTMKDLQQKYAIQSDKLIEDFSIQAPLYKNYSKESKSDTKSKIARFAHFFDKSQWNDSDLDNLIADGFVWSKALDASLIKGKVSSNISLHYPEITEEFNLTLYPLLEEAGNFPNFLCSLAGDCQKFIQHVLSEKEWYTADDVLKRIDSALNSPLFLFKVRSCYRAVIVDEFQDTDPLQWRIFSTLFPPQNSDWEGNLYLVGDPKQSIYSFRQADIYTYLAASKAIGENHCFSLSVNYRSQGFLVEALNTLFSKEHLPRFFSLPKYDSVLDCHDVQAAKLSEFLDENRKAVHFVITDCQERKRSVQDLESEVYFPFICSEIIRLTKEKQIPLEDFAVLVRDRYQALRLAHFFGNEGISFLNQRGTSLASSEAFQSLSNLIIALLDPRNRGKTVAAVATPLFGFRHHQLKDLESNESLCIMIEGLSHSFKEKKFLLFIQDLFSSPSIVDGLTVKERLLSQKEGVALYRDLLQITDCIAEHQGKEWNHSEGILPFMDQFFKLEQNDDQRLKRIEDPANPGVRIITLHMSKGLEFDVVFALGLINRTGEKDHIIPVEQDGQMVMMPVSEHSRLHQLHCEEIDAEKMRQLYVALTRAGKLLYIPAVLRFPSNKLPLGEASPMDLFISRLFLPLSSYQELYDRIRQGNNQLVTFLDEIGSHHHITYSIHDKANCNAGSDIYRPDIRIKPPEPIVVRGDPIWMSSFTAFSHQRSHCSSITLNAPKDYNCSLKTIHTLPANRNTGLLIHRIMEKISISIMQSLSQPAQLTSLIRQFIAHQACNQWDEAIAELIFNTVMTPLFPKAFSFSQLGKGCQYREVPFFFPYHSETHIEGLTHYQGMIKGVIDLLCYHDDHFYLVDWKTNWLGPDRDSYHQEALHKAMQENDYYLQASIYAEAAKRFLKIIDPRPPEVCFGGVFYLFVRGMQSNDSRGILFLEPKELGC